jgi:Ca2+-binding EF-hand superfamily protein
MAKLPNIIALIGVSLVVGSASTAAVALTKTKHQANTRTSATTVEARDVNQLIRLMDTDMNGRVSKQEFLGFMSQMFDRADVNKSEKLERGERGVPIVGLNNRTIVAGTRDVAQLVRLMDKDKNGIVSKQEFLDAMSRMFDRADANMNGELERNEVARFRDIYHSLSQGRQEYANPDRVPLDATTEPQL